MPYLLVHPRANEPNFCFKEGIATLTFETGYRSKSITARECDVKQVLYILLQLLFPICSMKAMSTVVGSVKKFAKVLLKYLLN